MHSRRNLARGVGGLLLYSVVAPGIKLPAKPEQGRRVSGSFLLQEGVPHRRRHAGQQPSWMVSTPPKSPMTEIQADNTAGKGSGQRSSATLAPNATPAAS
jgi:hypothetical protein